MNARPSVQNTASQKITVSIVLMLAPASWSIRKFCGFSGACQAKNVVQRNSRPTHRPRANPLFCPAPGAVAELMYGYGQRLATTLTETI
jgi:ABC-type cobalt transport system substrate-binding protein